MKNHFLLSLATLAVLGGSHHAHAQREAPDRAAKREQRAQQLQQMTPAERAQSRDQRIQERLKSATPEQRERILAAQARRQERQGAGAAGGEGTQNDGAGNGAGRVGRRGNRNRGGAGAANGAFAGGALTPAQRDESRRALMSAAGITPKPTQDAILAFINEQEVARRPVLQLARAAASSLWPFQAVYTRNADGQLVASRAPSGAETEAKVAAATSAYQNALAADKVRHQSALQALDAKISYSKTPRLRAFLSLVGVLDAEVLALGGAATIFPPLPPQNSAT